MKQVVRWVTLPAFLLLASTQHAVAFTVPSTRVAQTKTPHLFGNPPLVVPSAALMATGNKQMGVPPFGRKRWSLQPLRNWTRAFRQRVRRLALLFATAAMIWIGSGVSRPPPAVAAAAASSLSIDRMMPSASMDQMVDRYVQDHMFDDDTFDPVESAYREAYDDSLPSAAYPKALNQVTKEIIGAKEMRKDAEPFNGKEFFLARVKNVADVLQALGVPEDKVLPTTVTLLLATGTIGSVGGLSYYLSIQRKGFLKEMRGRYGDTYTVDASKNENKAADKDNEDDDDDDDPDDDDDDDDEDDDDDDYLD